MRYVFQGYDDPFESNNYTVILDPIDKAEKYNDTKSWLIRKYGHRVGTFLTNRLAKMIRKTKDTCLDNFRIAEVGTIEEFEYYIRQELGCCGFADEEFIFKDKLLGLIPYKRKFIIGFNYGH